MSTAMAESPPAPSPVQSPAGDELHLSFSRIVRSEWIKFASLRSTVWTLALTLVVFLAIVLMLCTFLASSVPTGSSGNVDGAGNSTFMFGIAADLAQLPVLILGVLVISGEYSTGMIRSTFAAVPRRLPALWAKAVVLAASIFLVSALAVGLSLGAMQLLLRTYGLAPKLSDEGTAQIVMGVPLYLTAIAMLAFAIGALLRHSAGALAAVLGLFLVLDKIFLIPWKPFEVAGEFLPRTAGSRITMTPDQLDAIPQGGLGAAALGPWQGYGVLLVWVTILLTAAALRVRHRDA